MMGKILDSTRRSLWLTCAATAILGSCLAGQQATAGNAPCCSRCGATGCRMVSRTVMVPMKVTETRMKTCVVKKTVERQETYTVFHRVPVQREFKKEICYLDDEVKTKEIEEKSCYIAKNPVVRTFRVKVPERIVQQEMVEREKCVDGQIVTVQEPCTKHIIREREEVRTQTCEEPQVVFSKTKRTIDYCVKVPKKREVPCTEESTFKLVPEERTRTVQACVPELVKKPVNVTVCKMVPQTVQYCEKCCSGHGHGGHSHHR